MGYRGLWSPAWKDLGEASFGSVDGSEGCLRLGIWKMLEVFEKKPLGCTIIHKCLELESPDQALSKHARHYTPIKCSDSNCSTADWFLGFITFTAKIGVVISLVFPVCAALYGLEFGVVLSHWTKQGKNVSNIQSGLFKNRMPRFHSCPLVEFSPILQSWHCLDYPPYLVKPKWCNDGLPKNDLKIPPSQDGLTRICPPKNNSPGPKLMIFS